MSETRALLVGLLLCCFSSAFGGARYSSPNAAALRQAIGSIAKSTPRALASTRGVTARNTRLAASTAQHRGPATSTRAPVVIRQLPGEIGAAHPTALHTLGGAPTGKSAIRAAIDGSVSRARPR